MNPTRFKILLGVAGVLLAMVLWNWISGWGLVTVHAIGQPLAKVVKSIERQAGVKIVTNADPTTSISMDVDRVPVAEAVDIVAARLDGGWTIGYAAGPAKADVIGAIASLQAGERDDNFARFGFRRGGGDFGDMDVGETAIDTRRVVWKVSPSDDPKLQSYLQQLSMKTGLGVIVPQSWNPELGKVPEGGTTEKAMRAMVSSVKGELQEIFVVRVQNEDRARTADRGEGRPERVAGTDGGFGGRRDGGGGERRDFNPAWMEERALARIEQLPAAEREQAKKDFTEMRDMFVRMRALPEDQRRAAMEKFFNDPAVQERMLNREMSRDAKRSPEKRADRFRRYIERKQQMKASS